MGGGTFPSHENVACQSTKPLFIGKRFSMVAMTPTSIGCSSPEQALRAAETAQLTGLKENHEKRELVDGGVAAVSGFFPYRIQSRVYRENPKLRKGNKREQCPR